YLVLKSRASGPSGGRVAPLSGAKGVPEGPCHPPQKPGVSEDTGFLYAISLAAGDALGVLQALHHLADGRLELAGAAGEVVLGAVLDGHVGLDPEVLHVGPRPVGEVDADAGGADARAVDELVAAGADDGAHRRGADHLAQPQGAEPGGEHLGVGGAP